MTEQPHLRDGIDAVLRVRDLVVEFPMKRGRRVHAVSGISFDVARGETLGIVGESGCGKSTTGRAIMQMPRPTSGSIEFESSELTTLGRAELREARTQAILDMDYDPEADLKRGRDTASTLRDVRRSLSAAADSAASSSDAVLEYTRRRHRVLGDY
ncbi:MAG: ATP-binding cassette domain-containing protein, partial [Ilumatobacteraceae bacterium]